MWLGQWKGLHVETRPADGLEHRIRDRSATVHLDVLSRKVMSLSLRLQQPVQNAMACLKFDTKLNCVGFIMVQKL